jgi:hypothetical protein
MTAEEVDAAPDGLGSATRRHPEAIGWHQDLAAALGPRRRADASHPYKGCAGSEARPYPNVLAEISKWTGTDAILIFTNVGPAGAAMH